MEFLTGTGLLAGASRRGIEEQEVNLLRSRLVFDAGEGLSEHTAPYDGLVLGVDGEAEISIAGVAHRVAMGQLLALPAGLPHAVKAATPFKMLLVMIRA